jgi:hypothetical protein
VFRVGSGFFVLWLALNALFVSLVVPGVRAQARDDELVARVGEYVERYYTRAQTLVVTESSRASASTLNAITLGRRRWS